MKKAVFVFSNPTVNNSRTTLAKYTKKIPGFGEYGVKFMCSDPDKARVLKKDIDLDITVLDEYDIICPVGVEALKYLTKLTSITKYNGLQVDSKYFPIFGLGYVLIKPQFEEDLINALINIHNARIGEVQIVSNNKDYRHITTDEAFAPVLEKIKEATLISVDIETTGFKSKKHAILGVNFSTKEHEGFFVDIEICRKHKLILKAILAQKKCVFHNGKFDQQFLLEELEWVFPDFEDTMILHYCLEEAVGTHGLKELAIKHTDLGDYDRELTEYITSYCKTNKIKKDDFNYGMLPISILAPYACRDGDSTIQIFKKFRPLVDKNPRFKTLYEELLIPASKALLQMELNGGPVDLDFYLALQVKYNAEIAIFMDEIRTDPDVVRFEAKYKKDFNPASPMQLSGLFFDILGLTPIKFTTSSSADNIRYSTDKEVLAELDHPLAKKLLDLRKLNKIANTYIASIIREMDPDSRLRSNFNIHGTTSGRLSSSGSLNYQNLPRGNKDIKKGFKARPGYCIVQGDLKTAEVYVASVLSNDKFLQQAFIDKVDFHSYIAKQAFSLNCEVEQVKDTFPDLRQVAKSITFGIMFQAGSAKIAEQANESIKDPSAHLSLDDSKKFIRKYFNEASRLESFIDNTNSYIEQTKYIYSFFGRKRRLREVESPNRGVKQHAIRSGFNFLIQSVASDINIMAFIEAMKWISDNGHQNDILPFALVHDSVVAEVRIDLVPIWIKTLKDFVQKDRGIMIPNCPIEMEFEVGLSWGELTKIKDEVTLAELQTILNEN